jgi:hypothetical protein
MPKKTALFASATLALAGANVMQVWSLVAAFLLTDQLPTTTFFTIAFWLWFATAAAAAWCGLSGGYSLLRHGDLKSSALTVFAIMSCIVFKVSGQELGYSSVRLAFNLGVSQFYVGVNVIGFLLVWWLVAMRRAAEGPVRPMADSETRGRGAV